MPFIPPILLWFISTGSWTSLIIECNEIVPLKGFLYYKYLNIHNSVYMFLFEFECDAFLYVINGSHFWKHFIFLGKFWVHRKMRKVQRFLIYTLPSYAPALPHVSSLPLYQNPYSKKVNLLVTYLDIPLPKVQSLH